MAEKINRESPLVQSVVALDHYLSELERIGKKIEATNMAADFDVDHVNKLMARFAECGEGLAREIAALSTKLREAQNTAEGIARGVMKQAELFKIRREEQEEKFEQFRLLGERARALNTKIATVTGANAAEAVPAVEAEIAGLLEDLQ